MNNSTRLIEVTFPLKQTSLDSVHEKSVRHGHLSTLHIWPARRPLAACRAALIATLLPDPGSKEERREILKRLAGDIGIEKGKEVTKGGILHWGRESGQDLEWFRQKIRDAFGGQAPKVLDPFAGGGAIPLEAMRLGCEATAMDINPVAWFILKCTLEYPQKFAGKKWPLPPFVLKDGQFMESYFKAQGFKGAGLKAQLEKVGLGKNPEPRLIGMDTAEVDLEADMAWQVRAWGRWVLQKAREDLDRFYPMVNGKPPVAYLWARTVTCKNCRATVPLLKTRWLCKKDKKRVLLAMAPNADKTGMVFDIQTEVPMGEGSAAARREHDKKIGAGTMSRSGVTCPCCGTIMTMEDLRFEGRAGRLGALMTAVVVDSRKRKLNESPAESASEIENGDAAQGKEYRLPTEEEVNLAGEVQQELALIFGEIPFGLPEEPLPNKEALGIRVPLYGFDKWHKLFTSRQLVALGTFVKHTRAARADMRQAGCPLEAVEALGAYLALTVNFIVNRNSQICSWSITRETTRGTFARFVLPITWDFSEALPLENSSGGYPGAIDWVARYIAHAVALAAEDAPAQARQASAVVTAGELYDVIITDPPYYDAIPYSDLMDFFYVWLRRTLHGLSPEIDKVFQAPLAPKWDHEAQDGELIDDASRFEGDKARSRTAYEEGMFRAFGACRQALKPDGRLVIVFANKQANAWETLVSALIRAGFVVTASWPIQTEMGNRTRALASAALSSSVWLVCQKRPAARPGRDRMGLKEMEEKIVLRLQDFWDAGIRGPDFIWAATGPAMEAYSKHPVVKKANAPAGENLSVSEFLSHVRRLVADFVVGRVLSGNGGTVAVSGLDDVTTYYMLHRHSFGLAEVLAGNCILYALACGLSDVAQEEPVEPVGKEDVAEVLRRRFFTMESIRDKEAFKPHVVAALKGIYDLDPLTKRDKQAAEARFFGSYPFHPDMTDVFYSKWTAMESFQRTRGILRTFALALRDAAKWDESPLVAANVFLESPDKTGIAAATRELSSIATTEEYEGRRQEWTGILEGELAKAREIQAGDGLRFREMEQAVLATFLHSQPIGQKALTRELLVLLGATRPDKITLEKALQQWADISWFLDDEAIQDAETGPDGKKLLPKSWKLGSKPNLRHHFCPAKRY